MGKRDKVILGSLYVTESSKHSKPKKDTSSPGYYFSQYMLLIGSIAGLILMIKEAIF